MNVKKILFSLLIVSLFSSCDAYKKVVYLQNSGTVASLDANSLKAVPDPVLKAGDLLTITVNSLNAEAAAPFNLPVVPGGEAMKMYSIGSGSSLSGGASLQNYLIDVQGDLVFPVLGKIHAAGLTKTALSELLTSKIYPAYLKDEPIITIRYANYKVSVLGEVNRPGIFAIDNERISILEAIAQAGDLTIYGQRENVLLIRENEKGERISYRIDLRNPKLVTSDYYYLQQNDVLYIQPNNPKSRGSALGSAESLSISIVGTLISLTSLMINILK